MASTGDTATAELRHLRVVGSGSADELLVAYDVERRALAGLLAAGSTAAAVAAVAHLAAAPSWSDAAAACRAALDALEREIDHRGRDARARLNRYLSADCTEEI